MTISIGGPWFADAAAKVKLNQGPGVVELDAGESAYACGDSTAGVSGSDEGRMRYSQAAGSWQASADGGAYEDFPASGGSLITQIPDNTTPAWQVLEGVNNYFRANTTNNSERIFIGNSTGTGPLVEFLLPPNSSAWSLKTNTGRTVFGLGAASPGALTVGNSTDATIMKFDPSGGARIDFSVGGGIGVINMDNDDAIRGTSNRRMLASNTTTLFLGGSQTWDVEIEAGVADEIRQNIATVNKTTVTAAATTIDNTAVTISSGGSDRFSANASGLGFFFTAPVAKRNITGSRDNNAALASILSALDDYGLIQDSTTAS